MNTQDPLADLLQPDELRAWAECKEPGARVGKSESSHECPIACYLNECTAESWIVADGIVARFAGYEHDPQPLPVWAMRFVSLVDSMRCDYVTREDMLAVLTCVEQEGD